MPGTDQDGQPCRLKPVMIYLVLHPMWRTAFPITRETGELLPRLFTLIQPKPDGYFLLRYNELSPIFPLGSMAPCVARTFLLSGRGRNGDRAVCGRKDSKSGQRKSALEINVSYSALKSRPCQVSRSSRRFSSLATNSKFFKPHLGAINKSFGAWLMKRSRIIAGFSSSR